jgi:hypothetical protein
MTAIITCVRRRQTHWAQKERLSSTFTNNVFCLRCTILLLFSFRVVNLSQSPNVQSSHVAKAVPTKSSWAGANLWAIAAARDNLRLAHLSNCSGGRGGFRECISSDPDLHHLRSIGKGGWRSSKHTAILRSRSKKMDEGYILWEYTKWFWFHLGNLDPHAHTMNTYTARHAEAAL